MDSSLTAGELERISAASGRVPGVSRVVLLRTRHMGAMSNVDLVVDVPGEVKVEQAHKIVQQVRASVCKALGRAVVTNVKFQAEQKPDLIKPTHRVVESHA